MLGSVGARCCNLQRDLGACASGQELCRSHRDEAVRGSDRGASRELSQGNGWWEVPSRKGGFLPDARNQDGPPRDGAVKG
jgi:hypothetical protein